MVIAIWGRTCHHLSFYHGVVVLYCVYLELRLLSYLGEQQATEVHHSLDRHKDFRCFLLASSCFGRWVQQLLALCLCNFLWALCLPSSLDLVLPQLFAMVVLCSL